MFGRASQLQHRRNSRFGVRKLDPEHSGHDQQPDEVLQILPGTAIFDFLPLFTKFYEATDTIIQIKK